MKNSSAAPDALALTFSCSQLISMEMLILQIGSIFCQQPLVEARRQGLGRGVRLFQAFNPFLFDTLAL